MHQNFKDNRYVGPLNPNVKRLLSAHAYEQCHLCDERPKMSFTYVVYVCSDISLSQCYLGSMERWEREASKAELKDMFQLSNDKRYVS